MQIKHQVPLEIDEKIRDNFENILPAVKHFLNSETMDLIRCYLTAAKYSDFEVSTDMHEVNIYIYINT